MKGGALRSMLPRFTTQRAQSARGRRSRPRHPARSTRSIHPARSVL